MTAGYTMGAGLWSAKTCATISRAPTILMVLCMSVAVMAISMPFHQRACSL